MPRFSVCVLSSFLSACCAGGSDVSVAAGAATAAGTFRVAEVKPHYGCSSPEGVNRVRAYIDGLAKDGFGLIAAIQMEFTYKLPDGYTAFGASCTSHGVADPVVVYVKDEILTIEKVIGETETGDYSKMPFVADGRAPAAGSMCTANHSKPHVGQRGYAAALLRYQATGQEFCAVVGTLPHSAPSVAERFEPLAAGFLQNVKQACDGKPILFVLDTNIFPDNTTVADIFKYSEADWLAPCDDPGAHGDLTCCNDTLKYNHSLPSFRFDRTAICRGGTIGDWSVASDYVCRANEEHRFTNATVVLKSAEKASKDAEIIFM
eukprot:TRINITY_DN27392_c0_g1_i1.p1 TRINITY_DN27392_c0_g1~~TRINITY_DN27392_c0_g1_i1.p1  ORF type:complete len:345 (+),score=51.26 TRINITY_DN27392_c0_g1_i1:79-1035(+)